MSISTWGIGITYKFPYKESLYSEIPAVYNIFNIFNKRIFEQYL